MAPDTPIHSIPIDAIYATEVTTGRDDLADSDLDALAADIKAIGLINPIHVQRDAERYKLLAGTRRLRATRLLHWTHISAHIHNPGALHLYHLALSDNLHRRNLTPIEQATAIVAQLETDELDLEQLAQRLGRDKTWLHSRIALLGYDAQLQTHIHHGHISLAAAKLLAQIPDERQRHDAYRHAAEHGCTATTARVWLQAAATQAPPLRNPAQTPDQPPPTATPYLTYVTCFRCKRNVPLASISRQPICPQCINDLILQTQSEPSPPPPPGPPN